MDLEKFLELLFANPDNIHIEYSNVNGQERFVVNGKEITNRKEGESFDDTEVLELIAEYKENLELLDDCIFMEMIDEVSEVIDLNQVNALLSQNHFTEGEAQVVTEYIMFMNKIIHEKLLCKIEDLSSLLERF